MQVTREFSTNHDTYTFDLGYVIESDAQRDHLQSRYTNAVIAVLGAQLLTGRVFTVELVNAGGGLVGPPQTTHFIVTFSGHLGMVEAAYFTLLLERLLEMDRAR